MATLSKCPIWYSLTSRPNRTRNASFWLRTSIQKSIHLVNSKSIIIHSDVTGATVNPVWSKFSWTLFSATDSAVPIGLILDSIQSVESLLSESEIKIQMIFFDGEEAFVRWSNSDSLYGSRHLAEKWNDQIDDIDLFILLDLIGSSSLAIPNYCRLYGDSNLCNSEYERFAKIEKTLTSESSVFTSRYAYSRIEDDHIPFYNRGLQNILHLIPARFPNVWHTRRDSYENLDKDSIMTFCEIFTRWAHGFHTKLLILSSRYLEELIQDNEIVNESPTAQSSTISITSKSTFNHSFIFLTFILFMLFHWWNTIYDAGFILKSYRRTTIQW